jgi:16S rRNA processing protein RimM
MAEAGGRTSRLLIRRRPRRGGGARVPAPATPADAQAHAGTAEAPIDASAAPDAEAAPDAFLVVARVLRPHGTQGELSCEIVTEFPQRFRYTKRVFLSPPAGPGRGEPLDGATPRPYGVRRARVAPQRGQSELILSLEDVPDRDAAEALRGWIVQVPEREAWKLPRGRYYWHQIVGLRVVTAEGEEIGTVSEILETGANDVYVVKGSAGERLIPAVKQVVTEIAPERGEMVVALIPGL